MQTTAQQACLNKLNKDGAAVAKAQGKENITCLKNAGKGSLVGSPQACLSADAGGKVASKQAKTTADQTALCASPPSFGFVGAAPINTAAKQAEIDLMADIFGANLDTAVVSCATSATGCTCQQKVSKAIEALVGVKLSTFVSCKKAVLKAGAASGAEVSGCVDSPATPGSLAADSKGKIAKKVTSLNSVVSMACDGTGATATAFPGSCTGLSGTALGTCIDTHVECRVCQAINEMDGFFVNCDLFDDGNANSTCASGTGPTPTPTVPPTPTPSPSPTPTHVAGTIFQGAIARTTGLWNYNAVNGLPGGQAECNNRFAGSHVCTYAELQSAEALGELAGATDVNGLSVTAFWAVIPAETDLNQCISAVGSIRWFYGTGHTASKGKSVPLTNATGALGSLSGPIACTGSNNWVGCCL